MYSRIQHAIPDITEFSLLEHSFYHNNVVKKFTGLNHSSDCNFKLYSICIEQNCINCGSTHQYPHVKNSLSSVLNQFSQSITSITKTDISLKFKTSDWPAIKSQLPF